MKTFYEKLPRFIRNCIGPPYKKLKPLKSAFTKNSSFEINRDPCNRNLPFVTISFSRHAVKVKGGEKESESWLWYEGGGGVTSKFQWSTVNKRYQNSSLPENNRDKLIDTKHPPTPPAAPPHHIPQMFRREINFEGREGRIRVSRIQRLSTRSRSDLSRKDAGKIYGTKLGPIELQYVVMQKDFHVMLGTSSTKKNGKMREFLNKL